MKKKLPITGRKFIAGILCFTFLSGNSQELSSIKTTESVVYENEDEQVRVKLQPLRKVLKHVESRFNIFINFDDKVLEGKFVDEKLLDENITNSKLDDPEKTLYHILKPLELEFEKVKENIYLIQPAIQIKSMPPKSGSSSQPTILKQTSNLIDPNKIRKINTIKVSQDLIKGRVLSNEGEPLPGVNILVKGTSNGTITDMEGNYTVAVNNGEVLVYSFIGYLTKEITVGSMSTINVSLSPDNTNLNEVVVIG
jgi:hypothetical protein